MATRVGCIVLAIINCNNIAVWQMPAIACSKDAPSQIIGVASRTLRGENTRVDYHYGKTRWYLSQFDIK
jgi:hypothetical protein